MSLALAAVLALLLCAVSGERFVDPDLYHLLALARESLALGRIPLEDRFAYTPTVHPSIHHEWGSGLLLHAIVRAAGGGGVLMLEYALAVGVAALCAACARRKGAAWTTIAALGLVGVLLVAAGFSTLRPQVFTLLFTAALCLAIESDRRGSRAWIAPWLGLFLVWVQLHAGFVVGILLLALHGAESRVRGRPWRHLALVVLAMIALVLVNPYGWRFLPAVLAGITADRSLVTEWDPLWSESPVLVATFGFGALTVAYAGIRRGWRRLEGLPLLAACALAAVLHQRHLAIFGVVWCSLVPAWIEGTPLADRLAMAFARGARLAQAASIVLAVACAAVFLSRDPFRIRVPVAPGDHRTLLYPAGAVRYLEEVGFRGNLMTPFTAGAFVSWKLHPRVKVSFDGRFEAAYPPEAAVENRDFYEARGPWRATLERHPTDAVLAPVGDAIARAMEGVEGWKLRYEDDAFRVFVRPGLDLPAVDRRGQRIEAAFP